MSDVLSRRDVWAAANAERAALADDLAGLDEEQWRSPSLCGRWSVEEVVAHLTAAASVGRVRWVASVLGARFDFDLHNDRRLAERRGATPRETLDRVSAFLGVAPGVAYAVPPENVKPYVADDARHRALSRVVRAGAALGAYAPPQVWRQVSRPLVAALHAGRTSRPAMPVEVRREVLEPLLPDIELLEELTGESFADWRSDTGRGDFRSRSARSTPH